MNERNSRRRFRFEHDQRFGKAAADIERAGGVEVRGVGDCRRCGVHIGAAGVFGGERLLRFDDPQDERILVAVEMRGQDCKVFRIYTLMNRIGKYFLAPLK